MYVLAPTAVKTVLCLGRQAAQRCVALVIFLCYKYFLNYCLFVIAICVISCLLVCF